MDKVVAKLVGLGVPGLVLLVAVATSGVAGGAAIVVALATLGGPFGMLGGIALLGVMVLTANAVADYGIQAIFKAVVNGLREKGTSIATIKSRVNSYPISSDLKRKILEHLKGQPGGSYA